MAYDGSSNRLLKKLERQFGFFGLLEAVPGLILGGTYEGGGFAVLTRLLRYLVYYTISFACSQTTRSLSAGDLKPLTDKLCMGVSATLT